MRILGIDPGTLRLGVGVIDVDGQRLTFVSAEVITAPASLERWARVQAISRELGDVIAEFSPAAIAMEDANWVGQKSAALALGEARGAILARAADVGIAVAGYGPTQVKAAVASGGAKKDQVARAVQRILSMNAVPKSDDADALAVSICHARALRLSKLIERSA